MSRAVCLAVSPSAISDRHICLQVVRPEAVGACQGLLGWVSYMGAACAGAPLAWATQQYGWSFFFSIMIGAAIVASALVVPMLNLKSFDQKRKPAATR